jgi:hypothetical protein
MAATKVTANRKERREHKERFAIALLAFFAVEKTRFPTMNRSTGILLAALVLPFSSLPARRRGPELQA